MGCRLLFCLDLCEMPNYAQKLYNLTGKILKNHKIISLNTTLTYIIHGDNIQFKHKNLSQ